MKAPELQHLWVNLLQLQGGKGNRDFSVGQVVTVLLKDVQGDAAVLNYQGKELLAKLQVKALPGTKLNCIVVDKRNGQILLKVLSTEEEVQKQSLRQVINKLGVDDNRINQDIIKEMIRQKMPLTASAVKKLSAFAQMYGVSGDKLKPAVFLHKHNLPLTLHSYNEINQMFNNFNYLQETANTFRTKTIELGKAAPDTEYGKTALKLNEMLNNLQIYSSDDPKSVAAKLSVVFRNLTGTPQVHTDELLGLLSKMVTLLEKQNKAEFQEIVRIAKSFRNRLEFVQKFNGRTFNEDNNSVISYSSVQFRDDEEPFPLMIKYRYGKSKKTNDKSSYKIELKLDTPGLGFIKCEVGVNGKNLVVQFITENEQAAGAFDAFQETLAAKLNTMNFITRILASKVSGKDEDIENEYMNDSNITGIFQINVRV